MIAEIQSLLDSYWVWLRDRTELREIDEWTEITTPYLDRHNDCIQIYARRVNGADGGFLLTDDGYTLDDLELSGFKIDSPKRQALFKATLDGFGVRVGEGGKALQVQASEGNFALKKHSLLQAILAVNDLFYLTPSTVSSLFYEDVVSWLDGSEIRYTPNVKFTGKSGYDHRFHFVIPKSQAQPERVLHAINRPSRNTAQAAAFSWIDTKETRAPESRAYAILNDVERPVAPDVLDVMDSYGMHPVPWSKRKTVQEELAA